jgi:hypothetical protein
MQLIIHLIAIIQEYATYYTSSSALRYRVASIARR